MWPLNSIIIIGKKYTHIIAPIHHDRGIDTCDVWLFYFDNGNSKLI